MLRSILAVVLGLVVANVVILAMEFAGHAVYPPPAGLNLSDPASLRAAMAKMPTGAFVLLAVGGVVGTTVGAWVAARISRRRPLLHGLIVGGLVTLGAIGNALMIPHPPWFQVVSPVSILPAAYAGAWLADRVRRTNRTPGGSQKS
jgi:hypothetical protein